MGHVAGVDKHVEGHDVATVLASIPLELASFIFRQKTRHPHLLSSLLPPPQVSLSVRARACACVHTYICIYIYTCKYTDIRYIYTYISASLLLLRTPSLFLPLKQTHASCIRVSLLMGIHCLFVWALPMVIYSFFWCVLPLPFLSLQVTTPSSALSLSHTHTHALSHVELWGACAAGACCDVNVMCCDVMRVHAVIWCGIWCDAAPTGHQRVNNPSSAMVAAV